jgi:hypothetical protein
MLLVDVQTWWLASFSIDALLALTIVEWLRAISSRSMGEDYSSALLPSTADQLDACVMQIASAVSLLGSLRLVRPTAQQPASLRPRA